jgi:hypothetical protein
LVPRAAGFVFSSCLDLCDALDVTGFNDGERCSFIDSDLASDGERLRGEWESIACAEVATFKILRFI